MSSKFYLRLLQSGVIISLFFVLFVSPEVLFPFIVSKQIPFNILMEFLLVFWLLFIWRYPAYRPKLNLMVYSLIAYLAVILISAFTGVDFNLSFWGDAERMLGFFHVFHFLILFIIIITVFREEKEWRALFLSSVVAATIISLIGILGPNSYSRIGNTAYVSGYLIFNLFFVALLFFRERTHWRYAYLIPGLIMLLQFIGMRTSGAIIGLAGGIFLVVLLLGILHAQKKKKIIFLSLATLAVIAVAFIFSQQEERWFQDSFLRNLTAQKATFQTRLLSWQGAWREFGNHPILGTGFGNYAIIFDKQFDPAFFNFDRVEVYFDRAHNNLIDIASTTGLAGLFTYLSIFVFALIYLYKRIKKNNYQINSEPSGRRNFEVLIILGLLAAYFIQNLAIFDSFVTYISLMIILGYIYWLNREDELYLEKAKLSTASSWLNRTREGWILAILLFIAFLFASQYNLRPWNMFKGVIDGYTEILSGRTENGLQIFRDSLKGTALDRDGRATLINLVVANPVILTGLEPARRKQEYDFIVYIAQENLKYNPQDNLLLLQMSQVYDLGARIFAADEETKFHYASLSLEHAKKAVESSPGRIPVYFTLAQSLLSLGKLEEATRVTEEAAALNPNYPNSYCRLGQLYGLGERLEDSYEAFKKCIDGGAVNQLGSAEALMSVASFFVEKEDFARAVIVVSRLTEILPENEDIWLNFAYLYLEIGDEAKAYEAAMKAVEINPDLQSQVEAIFGLSP